jgi:hypothetical protein|uniref:VWFA domain-containing protein n=1 Tax=Pseudo-nitzschia delicatissima TaxID=44447 RepID=A0A7S0Y7D8_9STRA|mmetsp:Transcript_2104/g.4406  ORF Transcript_2104/g.4406 Transcript_2104/m.4406 type:complete len:410 (+) Transcript_2104:100-1329(+)
MGFMKNMFAQLEKEVGKALNEQVGSSGSSGSSKKKKPKRHSGGPATRWEKAVVSLDKIITQVVKVDPDGVDIVCFGGEGDAQWYRNIKDTKNIEEMVNDKRPRGRCYMGSAMEECIDDAFDKDLTKRPVSMLVLTAGKPSDIEHLDATLLKTVKRLAAEDFETCPISITFVQIGHDEDATDYLKHLDNHIQAESSKTGETFDLVDTIKDEEIQAAMKEIKGTSSSGKNGALIGAIAGAAMGMGGMYLFNKQQAKKRTEGWNGKWKCTYGGEEICILDVQDDMAGNLTIDGFPSGEPTTGTYTVEEDDDDEYVMNFIDPAGDWEIEGTVEDEHSITWSDGTRWDEIPPEGVSWVKMAGAAAAGAAAAGATGYFLDKKFFNHVSEKDECDYIILMDRSSKMAVVDYDDEFE